MPAPGAVDIPGGTAPALRHRLCRSPSETAESRRKEQEMEHSLSATGFYAEPPLSPAPVPRGDASQRAPEFTASPPRSLAPVVELPRAVAAPAPAPAAEPEAKAPSLERMLLKFALLTPAQLGDAMREESATGRPLWEIVQERGWVSREDLIRLAERSSNAGDAVRLVPVPQVVPLAQPLAAAATPPAGGPDPACRSPSGPVSRFHPGRPGAGSAADPAAGLHAGRREGPGRAG